MDTNNSNSNGFVENNTETQNINHLTKERIHRTKRILCIGDSLTQGYHSKTRGFHSYSNKLSELLNSDNHTDVQYDTYNEGIYGQFLGTKKWINSYQNY